MTDIGLPVGQVVAELAELGIVDIELKAFGFGRRKPKFDEDEHPRDREGKFVEKGGTVKLRAGGTGEVLDVAGAGRIKVRMDTDNREVVVDAGLVEQTENRYQRSNRLYAEYRASIGHPVDPDLLAMQGWADAHQARVRGEKPTGNNTDRDEGGSVSPLSTGTVAAAGPGGGKTPMTEEEFEARAAYVEAANDAAEHLKTENLYSLNGQGRVWTRERAELHQQIVDEVWATAADVPNQGKAVFSGGMGGSGKTFTLKQPETGLDQSQYLTLNPDDIKEILAARGMVPDVPEAPDLSPMERANLIHEESSHITQLIAQRAYAERKNVIWDITMASAKSVQDRLTALRQARYVETKAVFVDISVEGSVTRAMKRYRDGQDRYAAAGEGLGGRFVPARIIRKSAASSFSSHNRGNFEDLKEQFDDWQVWDNSVDNRKPRLVYEKSSPNLAELVAQARDGLTDADRLELKSMPGTRAALYLTLRRKGLPQSVVKTGGPHQ